MTYADPDSRSQKLPSIAGVVAVHALLGYAFMTGLATNVIKEFIPTFTVTSIKAPPPPPANLPEPVRQKQAVPDRVTTPDRVVDNVVPLQRGPVFVIDVMPPTRTVDQPVTPTLPQEPVAASKAAGAQVRGNRAAWVTTEDYPSSSIRAEEEGTVAIALRIGADGRVAACTVTGSSGHPALDAATCRVYARRARFTPAHDRTGMPIESSYADRVRWELPRE